MLYVGGSTEGWGGAGEDGGAVEPGRAGWSREGASATYFGRAALNPGHFGAAATVDLLVVKLQILQTLGQGQLLLDGHAEEGVQRLLLVLRGRQLPLHVIQLGHVLIAPGERNTSLVTVLYSH